MFRVSPVVETDAQMQARTPPTIPVSCKPANQTLLLTQTLSLFLSAYPSSANPTRAPIVTQIGNGTRYMINITNSIPSGVSGDLGYSTLIVRVHDLSSTMLNDFTYYVLVSTELFCVLILWAYVLISERA